MTKEKQKEYAHQRYRTRRGRAQTLAQDNWKRDKVKFPNAKKMDWKWIADNILTNKCIYCGEEDFNKLGMDRIDPNKPHTKGNVVCACTKCNVERGRKSMDYQHNNVASQNEAKQYIQLNLPLSA